MNSPVMKLADYEFNKLIIYKPSQLPRALSAAAFTSTRPFDGFARDPRFVVNLAAFIAGNPLAGSGIANVLGC